MIERAKRDAKRRARGHSISHSQALELEALRLGFASWHDMISRARSVPKSLPVDPALPPNFEDTPNEDRPTSQLNEWWDRPYARSRPDGSYDVFCLHGGAWDRPTWLGNASDLVQALSLAERQLGRWLQFRRRPLAQIEADGRASVVQMAQRPDQDALVLASGLSFAEAQRWIEDWVVQHATS
jgi:hypothetical protein